MSLTWHQILELGSRIATSIFQARLARTDEIRVAQASHAEYTRWRDTINPDFDDEQEDDSTLESTVTLEGMSVQEG